MGMPDHAGHAHTSHAHTEHSNLDPNAMQEYMFVEFVQKHHQENLQTWRNIQWKWDLSFACNIICCVWREIVICGNVEEVVKCSKTENYSGLDVVTVFVWYCPKILRAFYFLNHEIGLNCIKLFYAQCWFLPSCLFFFLRDWWIL